MTLTGDSYEMLKTLGSETVKTVCPRCKRGVPAVLNEGYTGIDARRWHHGNNLCDAYAIHELFHRLASINPLFNKEV